MENSKSIIEVDLGHTTLECRDAGISVKLMSSAHFAPSEEDDVDQLRQKLTSANLTETAREKVWLRRDSSFSFILMIRFDAPSIAFDADETAQILSEQLRVAKVWLGTSRQ